MISHQVGKNICTFSTEYLSTVAAVIRATCRVPTECLLLVCLSVSVQCLSVMCIMPESLYAH